MEALKYKAPPLNFEEQEEKAVVMPSYGEIDNLVILPFPALI